MTIRWDLFLNQKAEDFYLDCEIRTLPLYDFVANQNLKYLFAMLHQEFNRLFKFMYSKQKINKHFNAIESRELLKYINLYREMKNILTGSGNDFVLNEQYDKLIDIVELFLEESGGSSIPDDLIHIQLVEYAPIFCFAETIELKKITEDVSYPLKLIGEGSYAKVFKYKDEFYAKDFIVKKANPNLDEKELLRFKKEYIVMKELKSPYVLEVYRYNDSKNQYIAEYADETIYDYIYHNNSKITLNERKNIIYQIFKAFNYIHSRGYLHRDISLTNVLLIHYDDVIVVKISDFGLVKEDNSNLTSIDSEVKGSLNDSNLTVIGFKNYSIVYETYALTRLILFILTGKTNLDKVKEQNIREFVLKGLDQNVENRYQSVLEMKEYFDKLI
ncbi:MAG: protein kinase family protein [Bacilli bacterium]|nr:protein kinase family protein [Bacilli bacterium]